MMILLLQIDFETMISWGTVFLGACFFPGRCPTCPCIVHYKEQRLSPAALPCSPCSYSVFSWWWTLTLAVKVNLGSHETLRTIICLALGVITVSGPLLESVTIILNFVHLSVDQWSLNYLQNQKWFCNLFQPDEHQISQLLLLWYTFTNMCCETLFFK